MPRRYASVVPTSRSATGARCNQHLGVLSARRKASRSLRVRPSPVESRPSHPHPLWTEEASFKETVVRFNGEADERCGRRVRVLASLSQRAGGLSWCSMAQPDTDLTVSNPGVREASSAGTVKYLDDSGADTATLL